MHLLLVAQILALPVMILAFKWLVGCFDRWGLESSLANAVLAVAAAGTGGATWATCRGLFWSSETSFAVWLLVTAAASLSAFLAIRFLYRATVIQSLALTAGMLGAWLLSLQAVYVTGATIYTLLVVSPALAGALTASALGVLWLLHAHSARLQRQFFQLMSWLG